MRETAWTRCDEEDGEEREEHILGIFDLFLK